MTVAQYMAIRMAKALEKLDTIIPAIGRYDKKATQAAIKQKILEKGIIAALSYPSNKENLDEAIKIVRELNL